MVYCYVHAFLSTNTTFLGHDQVGSFIVKIDSRWLQSWPPKFHLQKPRKDSRQHIRLEPLRSFPAVHMAGELAKKKILRRRSPVVKGHQTRHLERIRMSCYRIKFSLRLLSIQVGQITKPGVKRCNGSSPWAIYSKSSRGERQRWLTEYDMTFSIPRMKEVEDSY